MSLKMTKQNSRLLISFYDSLCGAEKARINGIELNIPLEDAVAAVHLTNNRVRWMGWDVPFKKSELDESDLWDSQVVISLILRRAFDEPDGVEVLESANKRRTEMLLAAGIGEEVIHKIKSKRLEGHSMLLFSDDTENPGIVEYLQKDAEDVLIKPFSWDEQLMASIMEADNQEFFDKIQPKSTSGEGEIAPPLSWWQKLLHYTV